MKLSIKEVGIVYLGKLEPLIQSESSKIYKAEVLDLAFKDKIQNALFTLRTLEQLIIINYFWHEHSINEIAKIMNISRKDVAQSLKAGLSKIKQILISSEFMEECVTTS